jgi:hypothetical protein
MLHDVQLPPVEVTGAAVAVVTVGRASSVICP